jgi:hypothetical protein
MAERRRCPGTLALRVALLALLAVGPAGAREDADDAAEPVRWYQVEVVLFLDVDGDRGTPERLVEERGPRWPADVLALAPPWPEPVRPRTVAELRMLATDRDAAVRLQQVTPGLQPEDERTIAALRRLLAEASRDGRTLPDLATLQWVAPSPRELARGGDARVTLIDPDAPEPVPVPAIAPTLTLLAPEDVRLAGDAAAIAPAAADAEEAEAAETEAPDPEDVPIPLTLAFRTVDDDGRVLDGAARRLVRAGGYDVLAHLAWRQPFDEGAPALPVAVEWTDPVSGETRLVGTVGVDLRRFLHVEFDLAWQDVGADGTPGWVHVEQSRRMRSGELHYVDHPRVGALVRADRFLLQQPLEPGGELQVVPIED